MTTNGIYIYDLLPEGQRNAISAVRLMEITGIKNKRDLNDQIRNERMSGKPIISTKANGGGYYKTDNDLEIAAFITMFEREARSILTMTKAIRDTTGMQK